MKLTRTAFRKISYWGGGGVGVLFALMFFVSMGFSGCMNFQMAEADIQARFADAKLAVPRYFDHESEEGTLRVAIAGDTRKPSVVFVHGSPGSWNNYIGFLSNTSLLSNYCLVAVDRPGFGRTSPRGAEPSMETQARRIHNAVVASGVEMPSVWVGHSLGGPVVARLAVDFSNSVRGLVLVAPSIDPDFEKRKWYNWIARFPLVRWGLSRDWRNSNDEIFPHHGELVELSKKLPDVTAPIIVVQGDRDSLVPPENAAYVSRVFTASKVEVRMLAGVDHFIPWSHPDEIIKAIRALGSSN